MLCGLFGADDQKDLELKMNGKKISTVKNCKDLGIFIDASLSWQDHMD